MNNKNFETKSAFVAIVGRPNVGKSSLLNALIGEKVAAVSAKPQTTRTRITGILTQGLTQFVFIDTPGLHKPKTKLADFMVKQVGDSVADVDIAILVVEPKGEITQPERDLIERFKALRLPAILCINKIDTLENKEEMLGFLAHEVELLERKSSKSATTKTQLENEKLMAKLKEALAEIGKPATVTELMPLVELSNQKISALLRIMKERGEVVKTIEKKKSYFSLAE